MVNGVALGLSVAAHYAWFGQWLCIYRLLLGRTADSTLANQKQAKAIQNKNAGGGK